MKCSCCDQKYDPIKARAAFCNHFNCPETVWKNGFEKKAICFKCAKILQDLLFEDMMLDICKLRNLSDSFAEQNGRGAERADRLY